MYVPSADTCANLESIALRGIWTWSKRMSGGVSATKQLVLFKQSHSHCLDQP